MYEYNTMVSQAKKDALKRWRQKNIESTREKTREQVKRNREKWYEYKIETKRLCNITL